MNLPSFFSTPGGAGGSVSGVTTGRAPVAPGGAALPPNTRLGPTPGTLIETDPQTGRDVVGPDGQPRLLIEGLGERSRAVEVGSPGDIWQWHAGSGDPGSS